MKIQKVMPPNFSGALNNKAVLRGLETIAEHGSTFAAATSFVMAVGVRPLAVGMTFGVDKENKEYASVNSLCSGVMKFLTAEAVALPIENAVKKIDKEPLKYLKKETVENLSSAGKTLSQSRDYKFATQFLKMGSGLVSAIPKTALTVALIPIVADKILKIGHSSKKENSLSGEKLKNGMENQKKPPVSLIEKTGSAKESEGFKMNNYASVFNPVSKTLNFKGNRAGILKGGVTEIMAKGTGKLLDSAHFQNFVKKFSKNDADIARNMSMATDLLLTGSFVYRTKKSEKIEEKRKNPLIYNNVISTGASLLFGYGLDNLIKKNTDKFIKKFREINKGDPKLEKYIEGINILRPTLAFAFVYYGLLPVVTTFLADKIDKFTKNDPKNA